MATLNELLQDFVNRDYEELVAIGKIAFAKVHPVLCKIDAENNGYFLMTNVLLSAIGADGKLTDLESKWLKDVAGLDDNAIDTLLKLYNTKTEDVTDALFDNAPETLRADLLMLVLSIMAVDEKIAYQETAFLAKLMQQ